MTKKFDAIIIGAGQAGPSMAGRLTAAGQTVAMIERKFFGGTCVNTGCKPTKTMVASAYAMHLARRAADYGFSTGGDQGRHEGGQGAQGQGDAGFALRHRRLARRHGALHGLSRPRRLRLAA